MELRKATFDDWELLLSWRNDPLTLEQSHSSDLIDKESHQLWLKNTLKSTTRDLYIAINNNIPIGTVRTDYNSIHDEYLLSWTIAPIERGKGFGKSMVALLVKTLQKNVCAEVKENNAPSIKVAQYAGLSIDEIKDGVYYFRNYTLCKKD